MAKRRRNPFVKRPGKRLRKRVPYPREEVTLWLQDSEDSLRVAEDNLEMGHNHVAAFYTHQALEKALKAGVIAFKGINPPKTHSLRRLHRELENELPLTEKQKSFLGELTPAAHVARYVDSSAGLPREVYSRDQVEDYLNRARRILTALKAGIQPP